jgi:hypothetical protein
MASSTKISMKVAGKRPRAVAEPDPVQSAPALPAKIKEKTAASLPKKTVASKKKKAVRKKITSPEDAILQSSAVDPDLEKAVKPKKTATKKALPKKRSAKKAAAKKKTAKKPASKKAKR